MFVNPLITYLVLVLVSDDDTVAITIAFVSGVDGRDGN